MQLPLEIATATGITLPPQIEAEIREKADGLNRFYPRVMRCRVSVEGPVHHHKKGEYKVHVTLTVPGHEVVVDHHQHIDLSTAVRDSFHAAARQLEDYATQQRNH
jgi:ribosome-associated translation inhibitor RaiA